MSSLLLGACSSMLTSDEPPRRAYWLQPVDIPGAQDTNFTVRVELAPGLGSDRINLLQPDQRLNQYAGAFWVDRLERIVPSLLERSLNRANNPVTEPGPRIIVLIERLFAVEAADPRQAPTIELLARVSTTGAAEVVRFSRPADSNSLTEIVATYQQAMNHLALEIYRISAVGD